MRWDSKSKLFAVMAVSSSCGNENLAHYCHEICRGRLLDLTHRDCAWDMGSKTRFGGVMRHGSVSTDILQNTWRQYSWFRHDLVLLPENQKRLAMMTTNRMYPLCRLPRTSRGLKLVSSVLMEVLVPLAASSTQIDGKKWDASTEDNLEEVYVRRLVLSTMTEPNSWTRVSMSFLHPPKILYSKPMARNSSTQVANDGRERIPDRGTPCASRSCSVKRGLIKQHKRTWAANTNVENRIQKRRWREHLKDLKDVTMFGLVENAKALRLCLLSSCRPRLKPFESE